MNSALLTSQEMDAHIAAGTFRLSFIGMSNAGKSYRSKVLNREANFLWYQVDEQIQQALGFKTMGEISSWLGYPTSVGYKDRERQYLELENRFTKEAAMETKGQNFVFDTTGSVAHLDQETLQILKENCLVVHLMVDEKSIEKMMEKFFVEPKPVAWCGYFTEREGETEEAALRRCYPEILAERLKKYRALAHINIPAEEVRDATAEQTLAVIKNYLG